MRHKEFLIAFAEGKNVERRYIDGSGDGWNPVSATCNIGIFDSEFLEFRIKPRTIKVERWVNVCVRSSGFVDERVFIKEHTARDDAQFLREDGQKVLAEAVHMWVEVEVSE